MQKDVAAQSLIIQNLERRVTDQDRSMQALSRLLTKQFGEQKVLTLVEELNSMGAGSAALIH